MRWCRAGEEATVLHGNRQLVCMHEVMGLGWLSKRVNVKETGSGRSMANCVTQRKPLPPCSQPLRSRGENLKPFKERWNFPRRLNGPFQKLRMAERQNVRRNAIIEFPRE